MKTLGLLTSGGDSPGMNAAIRAVVRSCSYYNLNCIGFIAGFEGLINNNSREMGARDVKYIINRGGTILKSARSVEFREKEGRKKAYETIKANNIDGLVVIGGDGSFTGAMIFEEEFGIPTIGIPGTIDNDIIGTDHTLGYDTALNTAVEAIDKIRDTATSHDRVFFVEVMGRDAGFIALNTGIACGAQDILIPEQKDSLENLVSALEKSQDAGKTSSIIIVAEGEELGGVYELAEKTKLLKPNYDIRVSVLGHIQRGGTPSCSDRVLGSRMGLAAVEEICKGKSSCMVGIENNKITLTPFAKAIVKSHDKLDLNLLRVSEILAT